MKKPWMKECNGCVKTWLAKCVCVRVCVCVCLLFVRNECISECIHLPLSLCVCTEVEVVLDSGDIFIVEQCTNESTGDFLYRKGERETERERVREDRTLVGLSIS